MALDRTAWRNLKEVTSRSGQDVADKEEEEELMS